MFVIPDLTLTGSTNPSHHRSSPTYTGLPTGLQPDCLHGLRTTLRYVLVLPLSSFSRRVCNWLLVRWLAGFLFTAIVVNSMSVCWATTHNICCCYCLMGKQTERLRLFTSHASQTRSGHILRMCVCVCVCVCVLFDTVCLCVFKFIFI